MIISLRDLPIKRKLMMVILLTSSFALLLMGSALIVYERITFRHALAVNMNVLAQIIGSNTTAALAFDDAKNAREILGGLLAENQIKSAAIYDQNGQIFASFPDGAPLTEFPKQPGPAGYKFDRAHLVMFEPISQQGTRLGTIYLQADLSELYSRFRVYGTLLLLVGACSFGGAVALSAALQRRISSPILELAKVATVVSRDHDYSVRATKQGRDEIGQLTEAFNEMLARIGESNAALAANEEDLRLANKEKDNFFAILSHELRTPLTPALAAVAMLEDDRTLPANIHAELEMIRRNIEVEARLIDDLLDINRIARGKLDLHRQVVDVRSLLEHALQNYCAGTAAKKNIRVAMEVTATETHVFADSSRLTQVFWNLLQNACKFTPEGGTISVRAYNEYRRVATNQAAPSRSSEDSLAELIVQIQDTGMGIRAESLPRIFNAFEQGARSRTRVFGGLGLGLSISRAIMEMHGGSIAAASEGKDKGATFTIRLHTVKPAITGRAKRPPRISPEQIPTRPMCVLVVEDHSDTAEQFARLLKRSGHEVICASSIREAQNYAMMTPAQDRACAFDILISDLDLPDGSGRDLMRNLAKRYPIRGIAISGHGMKEDVENSIAAGFSYHITKPVDWQELKATIQKIADEILDEQLGANGVVPTSGLRDPVQASQIENT
jgi:signal transduction histidine kinase/ActR/RegA family two-component response regulator